QGIFIALRLLETIPATSSTSTTAYIHLDNQAAIRACAMCPHRRSGKHLFMDIHRKAWELADARRRFSLRLVWIPGHSDIPGQDEADNLAKDAA
ncbi:hypothetical protein DL93DRAFT_2027703, partial [Clavulina sp. PMI_390]